MKKVFIFLTILLASALANAGVLDPGLASMLSGMGPQDELSIIVHLRAQADLTQFRPEQKAEMVAELHRVADETQAPFLSRFAGKLKDVGRFWVFNGFVCTAAKQVIERLAGQPEVSFVSENGEVAIPVVKAGSDPGVNTIEWNIIRVKADSVWKARGYTGRDVVVGNIDTGVDVTHPAFGNRWRQQSGWFDAVNGQTTPYDDNGHGTFCMGIAVGGGGNIGDTIGVAPEATFIAAKAFDSNGSGTYAWILACFQWYASLGNLAPVAINNSWGMGSRTDTTLWRPCRNLQLLGISLVVAVGGIPGRDSTVTVPSNYPCLFGVGASEGNSARGPAPSGYPWDDSTSWLDPLWGPRQPLNHVKPDLVAPGSNIRSAYLNQGYTTMSGTSASAPHLTGAIALLKQKNPNLSPSQLWQIIAPNCDTIPGGGSYPNYRYGWGRLNCLRAIDAAPSGVWQEPSTSIHPPTASIRAFPNPFVSYTSVPGQEAGRFALYDVSGRRVGVYKGDRVGADVPPGVYFLRPVGQNSRPLRVVKVR